jgi:hypothetical protein
MEQYKTQNDIATENEIFAWLQAPDFDSRPELTELGMSRYVQIVGNSTSSARLVELFWAFEGVSDDDRTTVQLLISGFDKSLILQLKDEADVQAAVANVRGQLQWPRTTVRPVGKLRSAELVQRPTEPVNGENWKHHGLCTDGDRDEMFTTGADQNESAKRCLSCPAIEFCLRYALENQIEHGVWGGMTERQRRALLRKGDAWRQRLFGEQAPIAS